MIYKLTIGELNYVSGGTTIAPPPSPPPTIKGGVVAVGAVSTVVKVASVDQSSSVNICG